MAKYHINPASGEVSSCRAKLRCPFGTLDSHFTSEEAGREFYEAVMEGRERIPLRWLLSAPNSPIEAPASAQDEVSKNHEAYNKLVKDLDEEATYALTHYTMTGFEDINGFLRNDEHRFSKDSYYTRYPETQARAIEMTNMRLKAMREIFSNLEDNPRIVYRYTNAPNGESVKDYLEKLKEDGEFTDKAFMSTSTTTDLPLYKTLREPEKNRFILEIATRKGAPLQNDDEPHYGDIQSLENEVLLDENKRYRVVSVSYRRPITFGGMKKYLNRRDGYYVNNPATRRIADADTFRVPVVQLEEIED